MDLTHGMPRYLYVISDVIGLAPDSIFLSGACHNRKQWFCHKRNQFSPDYIDWNIYNITKLNVWDIVNIWQLSNLYQVGRSFAMKYIWLWRYETLKSVLIRGIIYGENIRDSGDIGAAKYTIL